MSIVLHFSSVRGTCGYGSRRSQEGRHLGHLLASLFLRGIVSSVFRVLSNIKLDVDPPVRILCGASY